MQLGDVSMDQAVTISDEVILGLAFPVQLIFKTRCAACQLCGLSHHIEQLGFQLFALIKEMLRRHGRRRRWSDAEDSGLSAGSSMSLERFGISLLVVRGAAFQSRTHVRRCHVWRIGRRKIKGHSYGLRVVEHTKQRGDAGTFRDAVRREMSGKDALAISDDGEGGIHGRLRSG